MKKITVTFLLCLLVFATYAQQSTFIKGDTIFFPAYNVKAKINLETRQLQGDLICTICNGKAHFEKERNEFVEGKTTTSTQKSFVTDYSNIYKPRDGVKTVTTTTKTAGHYETKYDIVNCSACKGEGHYSYTQTLDVADYLIKFVKGESGQVSVHSYYESVEPFEQGLAPVKLNGKWGFIDKTGKEIIPAKFDDVLNLSEGLRGVALNKKYGFIDTVGNVKIDLRYEDARSFVFGLARVKLDGKWGFIDNTGAEKIPFKYEDLANFSEGLAGAKMGGQWGFINYAAQIIIPAQYNYIIPLTYMSIYGFFNGKAKVKLGDREIYIDKTGNPLTPLSGVSYDYTDEIIGGLARVRLDGKWGFIDSAGNEVVPTIFNSAYDFSDGYGKVTLYNGYIEFFKEDVPFIDFKSVAEIANSEKYANDRFRFENGLAIVSDDNKKKGAIGFSGKEIIPVVYDDVISLSNGLFIVSVGDRLDDWENTKYGIIDKTGKTILPLKYKYIYPSSEEGFTIVSLDHKNGFIDSTGTEVITPKYDDALNFSEGLARVMLNGKYGFIDKTGNEIIPLKYESATSFEGGKSKVKLDNREFYIDTTGKEVQ